jgi:hypothetical protein
MTRIRSPRSAARRSAYDANGNLTSDGVRTYTWNARNLLASLTGPVNAGFGYDAVGRRRVTPAMEAGVTDHVWTLRELLQ